MKRMAWMLAALVAVLTTAACGSSSDTNTCNTASGIYTPIQGNWESCVPGSPTVKTIFQVSGCNIAVSALVYPGATCTGTPVATQNGTAVATLGAAVPNTAFIDQPTWAPVTAYQVDIAGTLGGQPLPIPQYLLGYVSSTTPAVLYVGAPVPPNDGTTAAKRTTFLASDPSFTKF